MNYKNYIYLSLIFISYFGLNGYAAPPEKWIEFKPKGGEFSIQMPKRPIEEKLNGGAVPGATYSAAPASSADSVLLYKVTIIYDDLDKDDLASESYIRNLLTSMRDSYLKSTGCTLVEDVIITWNGYPAIDIIADCMGFQLVASRFVATEKFIVGAMVTLPAGSGPNPNKARFLESLKILK